MFARIALLAFTRADARSRQRPDACSRSGTANACRDTLAAERRRDRAERSARRGAAPASRARRCDLGRGLAQAGIAAATCKPLANRRQPSPEPVGESAIACGIERRRRNQRGGSLMNAAELTVDRRGGRVVLEKECHLRGWAATAQPPSSRTAACASRCRTTGSAGMWGREVVLLIGTTSLVSWLPSRRSRNAGWRRGYGPIHSIAKKDVFGLWLASINVTPVFCHANAWM